MKSKGEVTNLLYERYCESRKPELVEEDGYGLFERNRLIEEKSSDFSSIAKKIHDIGKVNLCEFKSLLSELGEFDTKLFTKQFVNTMLVSHHIVHLNFF